MTFDQHVQLCLCLDRESQGAYQASVDLGENPVWETAHPVFQGAAIDRGDLRHVDHRVTLQACRAGRNRNVPWHGGELDRARQHATVTVRILDRLYASALTISTGRRSAGAEPRGTPRPAHHTSPRAITPDRASRRERRQPHR